MARRPFKGVVYGIGYRGRSQQRSGGSLFRGSGFRQLYAEWCMWERSGHVSPQFDGGPRFCNQWKNGKASMREYVRRDPYQVGRSFECFCSWGLVGAMHNTILSYSVVKAFGRNTIVSRKVHSVCQYQGSLCVGRSLRRTVSITRVSGPYAKIK